MTDGTYPTSPTYTINATTSFRDTHVTRGVSYCYEVTAISANGQSAPYKILPSDEVDILFVRAVGVDALLNNNAESNTGVGNEALFNNTTGSLNTAIGWQALDENTTGFGNIAVGSHAGGGIVTGNLNIDIGNSGLLPGESGTIRIGQNLIHSATYIAGISGQTASGGAAVFVNTDGKLGTLTSSARFKTDIKSMDNTSEAILALKPVTFRYKKEIDTRRTPQFGLVAEDVEKVNPDLVIRDREGKPYTVRYEAVNAMLLNEFLKEHRKVEKLEATVAKQHKDFESALADLKGQIQKVSAQLEASKPAPQMVNNP
jgi:hypothetical protein